MRKNPRVSIGMPVYNGEKFIKIAIESILAQSFQDFELIISDNASSDHTQEICNAYIKLDSRIHYNRNTENYGASKNYIRVYKLSRGEYFRWANHDDYFAPKSLEMCVNILDTHKSVVLCYPKTTIVDENGNCIRQYEDNLNLRQSSALERFRSFYQNIGLSNVLYGLIRSDILRKTSLTENYVGADIVLIAELSLYGEFYEIPEFMFYRRFHPKSSSSDKSLKVQQEFFDPKTVGKICIRNWKHMCRNVRSVSRSLLNPEEKLKLYLYIMRKAIRERDHFMLDTITAAKLIYIKNRSYLRKKT
jgi:glycosyltransferase involved in cell wall biosynthesis